MRAAIIQRQRQGRAAATRYATVESVRPAEVGGVPVEGHCIITADGAMVTLTRVLAAGAIRLPVILAPGIFTNQWAGWNWRGEWKSFDGFDSMAELKRVRVPVLALAGGDHYLAPEAGCRLLFQFLGTDEKEFRPLSKRHGHRVD
jgi:hypothetical protein